MLCAYHKPLHVRDGKPALVSLQVDLRLSGERGSLNHDSFLKNISKILGMSKENRPMACLSYIVRK